MSTQLLTLLQLCVLALLYLFFFRVLRSVWTEVHAPALPTGTTPSRPRGGPSRRARRARPRGGGPPRPPAQLVVVEPADRQGVTVPLVAETTIGRAPGCVVTVEDGYVSQVHARVVAHEGAFLVEDLGSTNGTYVNSQRVGTPVPLRRGDLLQVGGTVLEAR